MERIVTVPMVSMKMMMNAPDAKLAVKPVRMAMNVLPVKMGVNCLTVRVALVSMAQLVIVLAVWMSVNHATMERNAKLANTELREHLAHALKAIMDLVAIAMIVSLFDEASLRTAQKH
jgi:hypothetical protein